MLKDKIHIGLATLTRGNDLNADYVASLIDLVTSINGQYTLLLNRSGLITKGRNAQLFEARKRKVDYLLMIDSDIVFPRDALSKLINLKKDIATGIYYKRDYPFRPEIHDFTDKFRIKNLTKWPKKPFKVDSCGAGFLLISKKVLDYFNEEIEEAHPFNLLLNGKEEYAGEDTSFCIRCKKAGFQIWADPSIRLGHIRHDIVWPEYFQTAKDAIEGQTCIKTEQIWTNNEEISWLTETAKEMDTVLEVGAWKGRSTIALLEGCKHVYTVDHFKGSDELEHKKILEKEEPLFVQFAKNVYKYDNLIVLKMSSCEASRLFANNSLDMIFLDGGHTYKYAKQDIDLWYPKARKVLCGHDYVAGWPGVVQAVDEKFNQDHKTVGTIWYIRK